jgi:hypothetical protein
LSDRADPALVREVLREVLHEMLPDLVADARATAPASSSSIPVFPPPPVAAVHRPSSWRAADEPAPAAEQGGNVSEVSISSDAELDAFVQHLLRLTENPRDRAAIRSGRLRFVLGRPGATRAASETVRRIDSGAVSERIVREAAAAGNRLVLGPRAVLTPMAHDAARSLGVKIEKEKRC